MTPRGILVHVHNPVPPPSQKIEELARYAIRFERPKEEKAEDVLVVVIMVLPRQFPAFLRSQLGPCFCFGQSTLLLGEVLIKRVFVAEERAALGQNQDLTTWAKACRYRSGPVLRSVQATSYHAGMRIVLLDIGILCVKMNVKS